MLQACAVLDGAVRIEMAVEAGGRYRLACWAGAALAVQYSGDGRTHRRRTRGKEAAYAFRSVEQLRYDFERDVADAQRPD